MYYINIESVYIYIYTTLSNMCESIFLILFVVNFLIVIIFALLTAALVLTKQY